MADLVENITTREGKGSPVTPAEMDGNLTVLQNAINGLAARLGVTLNADGTLKGNSITAAGQMADGVVTLPKLGFTLAEYVLTLEAAAALDAADKLPAVLNSTSEAKTFTLQQIKDFVKQAAVQSFTSSLQVVEENVGSAAHNLTGTPDLVLATIVCITPEHNYTANDEIPVSQITRNANENDYPAVGIWLNSTTVGWSMNGVTAWTIMDKTTVSGQQTVTAANWKLKIRAYKFI